MSDVIAQTAMFQCDKGGMRMLSLADNSIGNAGVKAIVSALDQHPDLEVILFSNA